MCSINTHKNITIIYFGMERQGFIGIGGTKTVASQPKTIATLICTISVCNPASENKEMTTHGPQIWMTASSLEMSRFSWRKYMKPRYISATNHEIPSTAWDPRFDSVTNLPMVELFGEIFASKHMGSMSILQATRSMSVVGGPLTWCEYPHIAVVAKCYLTLPGTFMLSGRVFSAAGDQWLQTKSLLCPDNVKTFYLFEK